MKHLKILGLSLFALVAIMAVSASAAQAEWELAGGTTLGEPKNGLLDLSLAATLGSGHLLVPGLNLKIFCNKGSATVTLETAIGMKKLNGKGSATFTECKVLEFEGTCSVKSSGEASGTIKAEGNGEAQMPAKPSTEVFADLSSANFTTVKVEGKFCPLASEGAVNGTARLAMADAATSTATHTATLDDVSLLYGAEPATLHGNNEPTKPISASVTKVGGGNWAIKLIGSL